MDKIPTLSELESSDKLVRILRLKNEAAKKRKKFYELRKGQNDRIIEEGDKFESENRAIFEMVHIDHIFTMIQSIESFHGALASARKLILSKGAKLDKVLSSLIDPGKLENVRVLLEKENIQPQYLHQIFAISKLEELPEPQRTKVRRLLDPTLKLIETMAVWSQKYWKAFKQTRHVYAHNYRFVFFEQFYNFRKSDYVESIVGFLDDKADSLAETVYVGPVQRMAMFELSMQLTQIERWIYQNMRDFIRNDYKATLPRGLEYHSEKDMMEYLAIRQSQGYNLEWESTPMKIPLEYKKQIELHESFLQANYKVTGRAIYQIEKKEKD